MAKFNVGGRFQIRAEIIDEDNREIGGHNIPSVQIKTLDKNSLPIKSWIPKSLLNRHAETLDKTEYKPHFDEDEFQALVEKAKAAWADVDDVAEWVEQVRGNVPPVEKTDDENEIMCLCIKEVQND